MREQASRDQSLGVFTNAIYLVAPEVSPAKGRWTQWGKVNCPCAAA